MKDSYNFTPDTSTCHQIDDTRFFKIQADKESVERFVKDLELFEKKRAEGENEIRENPLKIHIYTGISTLCI